LANLKKYSKNVEQIKTGLKINHLWKFSVMCSSRKYPYSPHRRDWNFLGSGGFLKTKKFKEMYEA